MGTNRHDRQVLRYQRLLVAYPRSHRQAYGPDMVQLFSDRLRRELAEADGFGLLRFWIRMLVDLARSAFAERTEGLMKGMRKSNWWLAAAGLIAGLELLFVVGMWIGRFTSETVTLFADGTSVRVAEDNGPLWEHVAFTGVMALGAMAIIAGFYVRSSQPRRGHRLMLAGLIPAMLFGAVFYWFPPMWLVSALAIVVAIWIGRELSSAIEVEPA